MIYFDVDKKAYAYEIKNPICVIEDSLWAEYAGTNKWDIVDGVFTDITNTEEYKVKQAQKERERIAKLSLTKREVFLGLYQAKGVTPEQIKAQITDPMALIEFDYANEYYRGNPLIDSVGATLGLTSEQLDQFFKTKDWNVLITTEEDI
jgi:hypothetical protein